MKSSPFPADAAGFPLDAAVPPDRRPDAVRAALGDLRRFSVGGLSVELDFAEAGPTLQQALAAVLQRRQDGQ